MITLTEAKSIHEILIGTFGGAVGIRDHKALEAALNRPYATFDKRDLYLTSIDKAAAILESIVCNHPFIDGNKRAGYVFMRLILMEDNQRIKATEEDTFQFAINVAKGALNIDQINDWISKWVEPI
ncbi:MAG: Fic family protein [Flavobacteriales bacterium]|nr:Fic family protein [Flavobacteriales bacterium]